MQDSLWHRLTSITNLLSAWNEFKRGKQGKHDVAEFELYLEDNLFTLQQQLLDKTYIHQPYTAFYVCDPKRRHIHKASVRDRVVHQAVYRVLYPIFDKHFIYDSYSSRLGKGTHMGVKRLQRACCKVSSNWHWPTYVLKCDIRRFFDSIDHKILLRLISAKITDLDTLWLIKRIIFSFEKETGKGLPLGNVTSQLFSNIYLNELDQFIKHKLEANHYFRYCDDFVIVHKNSDYLAQLIPLIQDFLYRELYLDLHPQKVKIRKLRQGLDFLGYVILPHHIVLRTRTKRRMIKKLLIKQNLLRLGLIDEQCYNQSLQSYLGILTHCHGNNLSKAMLVKISRFPLSRE